MVFNGKDGNKLEINNVTGCDEVFSNCNITYKNNTAEITLDVCNEGPIQVSYYDWLGQKKTMYWYIDNTLYDGQIRWENYKNSYKKKVHTEDNANENKDNGTITVQPDNNVNNNNSSDNNSNYDYVYDSGESYDEGWIIPGYSWTWNRDLNNFSADITAECSANTGYAIIKRDNPNIPTPTWKVKFYERFDNPNYGSFSIDISEYEKGTYDIFLYTEAFGNGPAYIYLMNTINMGEGYAVKEPVLSMTSCTGSDETTGEITYKFKMENCTEVKYKVIKRADRNVEYDPSILETYDGFQGTISKSNDELEININPLLTGSGTYDIIVYGICRAIDDEYTNIYRYIDVKGIDCEISPTIKVEQQENEINKQSFKLTSGSPEANTEIVKRRYVIVKQTNNKTPIEDIDKGKIQNPDSIANVVESGTFNEGDIVELTIDKFGAGYYTLVCYAENNLECDKFTKISSIMLSNGMKTNVKINDEDDKEVGTSTPRYVQNVEITTEDDLNEEYEVKYFVSDKDFEAEDIKIDENLFENTKLVTEEIKTEEISRGQKVNVELKAEHDKVQDKYVYVLSRPRDKDASYSLGYRTGAIRLDGTPLKITSMEIELDKNDANKMTFKSGDTIKVNVIFNHDIQNSNKYGYPNLILKVGDKKLFNSRTICNGACVTYEYDVTKDTPNGKVSLDEFLYNLNDYGFYGKNAEEYKLQPKLTDLKDVNFVDGEEYYIDTVAPSISSVEVRVTGGNVVDRVDENNNPTKFITNFEKVEMIAKYSEKVSGTFADAMINKGNKIVTYVYSNNCDERDEEIWDITSVLKSNEMSEVEGEISLFSTTCVSNKISDLAGNLYVLDDFSNTIKYTINGEEVTNQKILFDSSVVEPEIYVGTKRIENDSTNNTGVMYNCFAEFNSSENCEDLAGIKDDKVTLNIYHNQNGKFFEIHDKNDDIIYHYSLLTSSDKNYKYYDSYTIDTAKLPVTFKLEDEGLFKIETIKEDNVGNISKKEFNINTETKVELIRDKCQVLNSESGMPIDEDKVYCLWDNKLKYSLGLESSEIDLREATLYVDDNYDNPYKEMYVDSSNVYYYQFPIDRGGKFTITVVDKDGTEILRDYVEVTNAYLVGDTNFDGNISSEDTIVLVKFCAGMENKIYLYDLVKYAGNINGSINADNPGMPETDISDAVLLCRFIGEDSTAEIKRSNKDIPYTNKGGN